MVLLFCWKSTQYILITLSRIIKLCHGLKIWSIVWPQPTSLMGSYCSVIARSFPATLASLCYVKPVPEGGSVQHFFSLQEGFLPPDYHRTASLSPKSHFGHYLLMEFLVSSSLFSVLFSPWQLSLLVTALFIYLFLIVYCLPLHTHTLERTVHKVDILSIFFTTA